MLQHNDNKSWFTGQIRENMDSLFALAQRLTRNTADAEDLVADAVSKAWSSLTSLQDRQRFRPWIFRILHNRFISEYRKQSTRPAQTSYCEDPADKEQMQVASVLIQQPDAFLNWWANPEHAFANKLLGQDIINAIESLPESFRITVVLINVEGLSYDEAAEVLGVSPGTIRSRMNRGRTLLQKALWQHACDAGITNITDTMEYST